MAHNCLSVFYGAGELTLAGRFRAYFKIPFEDAKIQATKLIMGHKKAFPDYWKWVYKTMYMSKLRKYYQVPIGGWTYFIDDDTRPTQLQNIPIQSISAEITRQAGIDLFYANIFPVADLHDSWMFLLDEENHIEVLKKASQIMCDASADVLGADYMSTETTIIKYGEFYYDERGVEMLEKVSQMVNFTIPPIKKVAQIVDIHKEI